MRSLRHFLLEEEAATAVEYAVLLALITLAVVSTVSTMSNAAADSFNRSSEAISTAVGV